MMQKKNPFDDKQNFHEFSSCVLIIEFASKWHEEMWLLLLQIVKIRICCLCTYLLNMFVIFHLQTDGVELTVVSLNDFFQFEKLSISIEPFNHFWHHLAKKPFFDVTLNQWYILYTLLVLLQRGNEVYWPLWEGEEKKENHKSTRIMRKLTFNSWLKNVAYLAKIALKFNKIN